LKKNWFKVSIENIIKNKNMSILEKISSLAKRRGFIYPGSEIYGGLAGTWDYGPLGVELKRNIKNEFWKTMVQQRDDVVGLDGSIIMSPKVWEASGHLDSFTDPLVECKKCHKRFRLDLLENVEKCPNCGGEFTEPQSFNLMVETYLGSVEGKKLKTFLRGEITQGVHTNFKNVLDSTRVQLPFGIAQIGKAFRNEITPGQFTFRSREFEQMELQFYIKPEENESKKWYEYWKENRLNWYKNLGINENNLRLRQHEEDEMAHYAKDAWDIEYNLDGDWKEFEGIHHRGCWDVERHQKFSGEKFEYMDPKTNEKYLPWIIETSGGVDRAALFFLVDAYKEEKLKDGKTRTVLKLDKKLVPYKVAVFPLLSNKPELVEKAKSIYDDLKKEWMVAWDGRGNIGKRYRYQDEAGTLYCITIDFDSLEDNSVTIRNRDTMEQKRIKIGELKKCLREKLND
jgi:glycyl-tRNA synthetase